MLCGVFSRISWLPLLVALALAFRIAAPAAASGDHPLNLLVVPPLFLIFGRPPSTVDEEDLA